MREIVLEKTFNTRDFTGILPNHKKIKEFLLLRSDNTAYLSCADTDFLLSKGIKSIIDIRSIKENQEEKDILSNDERFNYYFFPFDCNDFAYYLSRNPQKLSVSLLDGYISLLEQKNTIKSIIETIATSLNIGGVLFHCSGGKDRTGLISMLIQSILGVSHNEILQDYHLSYSNLIKSSKFQVWTKKFGVKYIYCDPNLIDSAILYITHTYGTIEKYLISCGIGQNKLNEIKSYLVG